MAQPERVMAGTLWQPSPRKTFTMDLAPGTYSRECMAHAAGIQLLATCSESRSTLRGVQKATMSNKTGAGMCDFHRDWPSTSDSHAYAAEHFRLAGGGSNHSDNRMAAFGGISMAARHSMQVEFSYAVRSTGRRFGRKRKFSSSPTSLLSALSIDALTILGPCASSTTAQAAPPGRTAQGAAAKKSDLSAAAARAFALGPPPGLEAEGELGADMVSRSLYMNVPCEIGNPRYVVENTQLGGRLDEARGIRTSAPCLRFGDEAWEDATRRNMSTYFPCINPKASNVAEWPHKPGSAACCGKGPSNPSCGSNASEAPPSPQQRRPHTRHALRHYWMLLGELYEHSARRGELYELSARANQNHLEAPCAIPIPTCPGR